MSFWSKLGEYKFKDAIPLLIGLVVGFLINLWVQSNITFEQLQSLFQMIIDSFK